MTTASAAKMHFIVIHFTEPNILEHFFCSECVRFTCIEQAICIVRRQRRRRWRWCWCHPPSQADWFFISQFHAVVASFTQLLCHIESPWQSRNFCILGRILCYYYYYCCVRAFYCNPIQMHFYFCFRFLKYCHKFSKPKKKCRTNANSLP